MIVPPAQLLTQDPAWVGCSPDRFNGVDPPYALTPAADAPSPFSATITPPALPTKTPASPSSALALPPQSTETEQIVPTSKPVDVKPSTLVDPPPPPKSTSVSIDSSTSLGDVHSSNPDSMQAILPSSTPVSPIPGSGSTLDSPGSTITPAPLIVPAALTTTYAGEAHTIAILSLVEPLPSQGSNPIPQSDVAVLIMSAFDLAPSSPQASPTNDFPQSFTISSLAQDIITIADQVATIVDASKLLISGSTILLDGSPITIRSEILALQLSDMPGARTDCITAPTIPKPMTISLPVGLLPNQPVLLAPGNAVVIDGTTLSTGGAHITIDGDAVRVQGSFLVIGSSTIPLQQTTTFDPRTEAPSADVMPTLLALPDGEVLTLGGPTLTVSGTDIHYGPDGLVLGTETIAVSGSGMRPEATATESELGGTVASGSESATSSLLAGSGGPVQSVLAFEGTASGPKSAFPLLALGLGVWLGVLGR